MVYRSREWTLHLLTYHFFSSARTDIAFKENKTKAGQLIMIPDHLNRHSEEEKRRIIMAQSLG